MNVTVVSNEKNEYIGKALEGLARSKEGELLLRWLLTETRLMLHAPIESTNGMLVNEGRRTVGLALYARMCKALGNARAGELLGPPRKEEASNG